MSDQVGLRQRRADPIKPLSTLPRAMVSDAGTHRRLYQDCVDSRWKGVPPDQDDSSPKENAFKWWSMSDAMATQETCAKLLSDPRLSKTEAHEFLQNVWGNIFNYAGLTRFPDKTELASNLEKLSGACEDALDYMMTKQILLEDALSPAELAIWQSTPPLGRGPPSRTLEQRQVICKYAIYFQAKWRGEIIKSTIPAMDARLSDIVNGMKADFKKQFRAGLINLQHKRAKKHTPNNMAEFAEKCKRNDKRKRDRSDEDSGSDYMREKKEKKKPAARRPACPSSEEASDSPPKRSNNKKKQRTARGSAASGSKRAE